MMGNKAWAKRCNPQPQVLCTKVSREPEPSPSQTWQRGCLEISLACSKRCERKINLNNYCPQLAWLCPSSGFPWTRKLRKSPPHAPASSPGRAVLGQLSSARRENPHLNCQSRQCLEPFPLLSTKSVKWGEQYSVLPPRPTSLRLSRSCCAGIKQTRQACSQLSAKKNNEGTSQQSKAKSPRPAKWRI